ncbi:2-oxoacid:ferredoxin oxidoreductase subunit beta, partial [Streptomyces sp. NPDC012438]
QAQEAVIRLEHGQPIRFGTDHTKGVVRNPATGELEVVTVTPANENDILIHDTTAGPTTAFALSRLADPDTLHHTPIGVFRAAQRPVYDTLMTHQLDTAVHQHGKGDLTRLLTGNDTWTVND